MNSKRDVKGFFKKSFMPLTSLLVVVLIAGLFIQNGMMVGKMNKILNDSTTAVHEIYDDTKVIQAYKAGSRDGLDEKQAFLYDTLMEVIPQITTEGMSDYEKEKAAYDWVFGITHFSDESLNPMNAGRGDDNYTPYGVIKGHEAICVGNATTFKLFMDAMDIPCKIVHSTQQGEHAWDVVRLDDEWYHVDLTFDGGNQSPSYSYFNVPDSMKDDGTWPYDHDLIPECRGTKYCYMLLNAAELKDMCDIPGALADLRDSGGGSFSFTLSDMKGFTSSVAEYIASAIMIDGDITYTGMYALDGKKVMVYNVEVYNDNSDVPEDITEKLSPMIDKANEGVYNSLDGSSDYALNSVNAVG